MCNDDSYSHGLNTLDFDDIAGPIEAFAELLDDSLDLDRDNQVDNCVGSNNHLAQTSNGPSPSNDSSNFIYNNIYSVSESSHPNLFDSTLPKNTKLSQDALISSSLTHPTPGVKAHAHDASHTGPVRVFPEVSPSFFNQPVSFLDSLNLYGIQGVDSSLSSSSSSRSLSHMDIANSLAAAASAFDILESQLEASRASTSSAIASAVIGDGNIAAGLHLLENVSDQTLNIQQDFTFHKSQLREHQDKLEELRQSQTVANPNPHQQLAFDPDNIPTSEFGDNFRDAIASAISVIGEAMGSSPNLDLKSLSRLNSPSNQTNQSSQPLENLKGLARTDSQNSRQSQFSYYSPQLTTHSHFQLSDNLRATPAPVLPTAEHSSSSSSVLSSQPSFFSAVAKQQHGKRESPGLTEGDRKNAPSDDIIYQVSVPTLAAPVAIKAVSDEQYQHDDKKLGNFLADVDLGSLPDMGRDVGRPDIKYSGVQDSAIEAEEYRKKRKNKEMEQNEGQLEINTDISKDVFNQDENAGQSNEKETRSRKKQLVEPGWDHLRQVTVPKEIHDAHNPVAAEPLVSLPQPLQAEKAPTVVCGASEEGIEVKSLNAAQDGNSRPTQPKIPATTPSFSSLPACSSHRHHHHRPSTSSLMVQSSLTDKRLSHKSSNLSSKIRNSTASRLSSLVSFSSDKSKDLNPFSSNSVTSITSSATSSLPKHLRQTHQRNLSTSSSSGSILAVSGVSNISTPTLISSSSKSINGKNIPLNSRPEVAAAATVISNNFTTDSAVSSPVHHNSDLFAYSISSSPQSYSPSPSLAPSISSASGMSSISASSSSFNHNSTNTNPAIQNSTIMNPSSFVSRKASVASNKSTKSTKSNSSSTVNSGSTYGHGFTLSNSSTATTITSNNSSNQRNSTGPSTPHHHSYHSSNASYHQYHSSSHHQSHPSVLKVAHPHSTPGTQDPHATENQIKSYFDFVPFPYESHTNFSSFDQLELDAKSKSIPMEDDSGKGNSLLSKNHNQNPEHNSPGVSFSKNANKARLPFSTFTPLQASSNGGNKLDSTRHEDTADSLGEDTNGTSTLDHSVIALATTLYFSLWVLRNIIFCHDLYEKNADGLDPYDTDPKNQANLNNSFQNEIRNHIAVRQEAIARQKALSAKDHYQAYADIIQGSSQSQPSLSIPENSAQYAHAHAYNRLHGRPHPQFQVPQMRPMAMPTELKNTNFQTAPIIDSTDIPGLPPLPQLDPLGVFISSRMFIPKHMWRALHAMGLSGRIVEQRVECIREAIRLGEAYLAQQSLVREGSVSLSSWEDVQNESHNPFLRPGKFTGLFVSPMKDMTPKGTNLKTGIQRENFGKRSGYNYGMTTSFASLPTAKVLEVLGTQLSALELEFHMAWIEPISTESGTRQTTSTLVTQSGTRMIASTSSTLDNLEPTHSPGSGSKPFSRDRSRTTYMSSSTPNEHLVDFGSDFPGGYNTLKYLGEIEKTNRENAVGPITSIAKRVISSFSDFRPSPLVFCEKNNTKNDSSNTVGSTVPDSLNPHDKMVYNIYNSDGTTPAQSQESLASIESGVSVIDNSTLTNDDDIHHQRTLRQSSSFGNFLSSAENISSSISTRHRPDRSISSFRDTYSPHRPLMPSTSHVSLASVATTASSRSGISSPFTHLTGSTSFSSGPTMITNKDFERTGSLATVGLASSSIKKERSGISKLWRKSKASLGGGSSPNMITSNDIHRRKRSFSGSSGKAMMITSDDILRQREAEKEESKAAAEAAQMAAEIAEYNEFRSQQQQAPPGSIGAGVPIGTEVFSSPTQKRRKKRSNSSNLAPILSSTSSLSSSSSTTFGGTGNVINPAAGASSRRHHKHTPSSGSTTSTISTMSARSVGSSASQNSRRLLLGKVPSSVPYTHDSSPEKSYSKEKSLTRKLEKLSLDTSIQGNDSSTDTSKTAFQTSGKWNVYSDKTPSSSSSSSLTTPTTSVPLTTPSAISSSSEFSSSFTSAHVAALNYSQPLSTHSSESESSSGDDLRPKSEESKPRSRILPTGLPVRGVPCVPGTYSSGKRSKSADSSSPDETYRTKSFIISGVGERSRPLDTIFGVFESLLESQGNPATSTTSNYGFGFPAATSNTLRFSTASSSSANTNSTNSDNPSLVSSRASSNISRYSSFSGTLLTTRDEFGNAQAATLRTYIQTIKHLQDVLTSILGEEESNNLFSDEVQKHIDRHNATTSQSASTEGAGVIPEQERREMEDNLYKYRARTSASSANYLGGQQQASNEQDIHAYQPMQIGVAISSPPHGTATLATSPTTATAAPGSLSSPVTQRRISNGLVRKQGQQNLQQPNSVDPRRGVQSESMKAPNSSTSVATADVDWSDAQEGAESLNLPEYGVATAGDEHVISQTSTTTSAASHGSSSGSARSGHVDTGSTSSVESLTDMELQELELSEEWAHSYGVFVARVVVRHIVKDIFAMMEMYQQHIRQWMMD